MGEFVTTHTTFVEGGRMFGETLAKQPFVKKVHQGRMTGRASSQPRILIHETETTVQVVLGVGNGHQFFFVHPENGMSLEELASDHRVLQNARPVQSRE